VKCQLTKIEYHDGSFYQFGYDSLGRKISETGGAGGQGTIFGTVKYTGGGAEYNEAEYGEFKYGADTTFYGFNPDDYDSSNRLTAIRYPGGKTISYSFDNRGRLVSVTDAGGMVMVYNFDDDHDGRISSITKDSQTVTYTYDDTPETGEGKFLHLTLPNGIKKETIFNEDTGRLETIRYSKDSKVLYQFDYTFDNRGMPENDSHINECL
jgi:YD repeat-containing protein